MLHSLSNIQIKQMKSLVLLTSPVTGDVDMSLSLHFFSISLRSAWTSRFAFPTCGIFKTYSIPCWTWGGKDVWWMWNGMITTLCIWLCVGVNRERTQSEKCALCKLVGFLSAHHYYLLVLFKPLICSLFFFESEEAHLLQNPLRIWCWVFPKHINSMGS